ncbi:MAG: ABC-2 family transporter protein [Planctomycetota bacterium]|nr:ABC-2 family transporter protein [Planctomycetota bacterium]
MLALGYAFARSSFLVMLTHRLRYLIGVFNYFVYATVAWYLWAAVFASQSTVATWNLRDMQTYVCVNWIVRSTYFSNADNLLAARIRKGEIVSDLLRPTSLLLQFYGSAVGEMVFRAFFMGLPVGLVIWLIYGLRAPADYTAAVCFTFSVVLAFHLFFAINFLTGLAAVLVENLQGFLWAKFLLIQFLSGQLLPLEFFPEAVRPFMAWSPFPGIAHTPMSIYLGRMGHEQMLREVAFQGAWTLVLLLGCQWGWAGVRRRFTAQGG